MFFLAATLVGWIEDFVYRILILRSVFSDCVVFYGDIIFILSTAVMLQIILLFLSLRGTCAYSGLQDVGNRHDV